LNSSARHQHQIEQRLTSELRRIEGPYRHALQIVESLPSESAPGYAEISECLSRLQPVMEHINHIEAALAPLRREWIALSARPGEDLRTTLDVHEQLLQGLIRRIDRMEQQLAQQRQTLLPAVDAEQRRQRMKRAYGG
jgi:hypothetical protein